jgi:hypothetical protein
MKLFAFRILVYWWAVPITAACGLVIMLFIEEDSAVRFDWDVLRALWYLE